MVLWFIVVTSQEMSRLHVFFLFTGINFIGTRQAGTQTTAVQDPPTTRRRMMTTNLWSTSSRTTPRRSGLTRAATSSSGDGAQLAVGTETISGNRAPGPAGGQPKDHSWERKKICRRRTKHTGRMSRKPAGERILVT